MILQMVAMILGGLAGAGLMLAWGISRRHSDAAKVWAQILQTMTETADGAAVYDSRRRLIACNQRYRNMYAAIADLCVPGARLDDLLRAIARSEGRDEAWVQQRLSHAADGLEEQLLEGQWVSITSYPVLNGGQLRILRDVSHRKQVEESLDNTVAWLKGVMDTVVDGIVTIDDGGAILTVNRAAQRIFGYGPDELVGRNVGILMPPPVAQAHDGYVSSYLQTGFRRIIGVGREVQGRRRDGSVFPLDISVTEMRQGDMLTFIGVLRDITQRKRYETALIEGERRVRAQAARLQAIIDNMPQGLAVFAADDSLVALNEAATRLLDLPSAEITPGTIDISLFLSLLATDPTPAGEDAVVRTTELADTIRRRPQMVFEHVGDNGLTMEVRSSSMPGDGLILSFTDVTDRKRTEQTLRDAKEAAERGNRAKNTFLANISHELRTPLNAIIGFSEMMKHEIFGAIEPKAYRPYIDDIHDSGMHLLELINDILDMSKAEAGMTDLIEGTVDVAAIIHASVRMLARRAASAGLMVDEIVTPGLPPVRADERRMRQIVLNLLSNAVKFSDDGGRIRVDARVEPRGLLITVSDSGIGMSPDDLERVMEPFVQADTRLSRRYEGSGLGLPLTKALVEAHGGTFRLDSAPGRGTVATVCLPPERIVAAPLPRPVPPAGPSG